MQMGVTIGIAGHVDHGKTSLVKALSGIDTDRMKQEKRRGLSIESGVAPLTLPNGRTVALVDVPGHTDYLKNTIRGLSCVDLAVLVVAADDGVMPQSREHLDILEFCGARGGLCVLSKADLVDEETLEIAELELQEVLAGSFLDGSPVVRFSAVTGSGKHEIIGHIENEIANLSACKENNPFRLWVDQVRAITGLGTVVSGTVRSGSIRLHDKLMVMPQRIVSRIRSMESHNRPVEKAAAGQRVGINLHQVRIADLKRGTLLCAPDIGADSYLLNVGMKLLNRSLASLNNRQRVKLYIGTAVVNALVVLMDADWLDPGERGLVQFRLLKPLAVMPRDRFVITPLNRPTIMGGGKILEVPSEKFRQAKAGRILPYLEALRTGDIGAFVDSYFASVAGTYTDAHALARATCLAQAAFEAQISARVNAGELIYLKRYGACRKDTYEEIKARMLTLIRGVFRKDPLKKNINRIEMMNLLDHSLDDIMLAQLIEELCSGGHLKKIEGGYALTDDQGQLSPAHGQLADALLAYSRQTGLTPFSADTFWKANDRIHEKATVKQLLNYLSSRNRLVRLNDQRFLSIDPLEEIKRRVEKHIRRHGCVRLADCKAILGYGRWGGVHVFDYLDDIGFTSRVGDRRLLKERWSHGANN